MSPKTPDGPAQALSQQTYRDGDVAVIDRVALIKAGCTCGIAAQPQQTYHRYPHSCRSVSNNADVGRRLAPRHRDGRRLYTHWRELWNFSVSS